jgi:UDP-N-acetylmuramoylalanine--D-glutamate ligase
LIGEASPIIKQQLAGAAKMYNCQNMEGALNFASKNAKPGSVVLLSPACASFDQYKNYEARGRHFKSIVKSLR